MEVSQAVQPTRVGKIVGGASLIAGTCIGAGMLGMPAETAIAGFWPSVVIYLICWFFMTQSGLLISDLCLQSRTNADFRSITAAKFGKVGGIVSSALYLCLFFSLMVVYTKGGGELVSTFMPSRAPAWLGTTLFFTFLAPLVVKGSAAVAPINGWLIGGLLATYVGFTLVTFGEVDSSLLNRSNWGSLGLTLPVIVTSFGFQGTVPILVKYMNHDRSSIRWSIVWGSVVALAGYIAWQWLILGSVPYEGSFGLKSALARDQTVIPALQQAVGSSVVFHLGRLLGLFALVSSFLGVGIALVDFLHQEIPVKALQQRGTCCLVALAVPFCITLICINVFYGALRYGGGLGCLILLVALPTAIAWVSRTHQATSSTSRSRPVVLVGLSLFVLVGLTCEIAHIFA